MSADAIFAVVYGVVMAAWIATAVARGGWQAMATTMGRDIGTVIALFGATVKAMSDTIDQVANGIRETATPTRRPAATTNPRESSLRAAYLRDEIDLDEYERRVELLLAGRPAVPPSEEDRELVRMLAARRCAVEGHVPLESWQSTERHCGVCGITLTVATA